MSPVTPWPGPTMQRTALRRQFGERLEKPKIELTGGEGLKKGLKMRNREKMIRKTENRAQGDSG